MIKICILNRMTFINVISNNIKIIIDRHTGLFSFAMSLFLHIFFTGLAILILSKEYSQKLTIEDTQLQPIPIELLTEKPQKIKTVGKEDGQEDFQVPLLKKDPVPTLKKDFEFSSEQKQTTDSTSEQNIAINNIETKTEVHQREEPSVDEDSFSAEFVNKNKLEKKSNRPNNQVSIDAVSKTKMLKEIQLSPYDFVTLNNSDLNISFSIPKGVSADKLSDLEKMFYSFQKRVFERYVSAFLLAYRNKITNKPYLNNSIFNGNHLLTGKIVFDANGNIVSIKMIRFTDKSELQDLFDETLQGVNAMYNPPKALLNENNELEIYYKLTVSD